MIDTKIGLELAPPLHWILSIKNLLISFFNFSISKLKVLKILLKKQKKKN